MSNYEIVNMAGTLTLVLAAAMVMGAFSVPDGVRSRLGFILVVFGCFVGICGVLDGDTRGRTVAQDVVALVVYTFR